MYPEDRVMVAVLNRQRDFRAARDEHWYRIPQARAPRNVEVEYLAFYLSHTFKELNGSIAYFARRTGHELVRRRDLLPDEANHERAYELYYKMQLGELQPKQPPILNPTRRPIAFLFTTWDRFVAARSIADLYSTADWFVERVAQALRRSGIQAERRWEAEDPAQRIAELRIRCDQGVAIASTGEARTGALNLTPGDDENAVNAAARAIQAAVQALGGPTFVDIPLEN